MRWRYRLLLALMVLVGVPFYWLLVDNHASRVREVRFDLAALRRLAEATPGAKPERVVVQPVASRRVPGTVLVAGGGLKPDTVTVLSFLLDRPDGGIVIDSGVTDADARALGFSRYAPDSQAKVEAAMHRARLLLFTHEHLDHIGGFVRSPRFAELAAKALVTPEQLAAAVPWPAGARGAIRPFAYRGMTAVAPGVVLIRTPGHTPGSQMVFVRLANGREYLFAGDTATMGRSWRWGRARSRLVASYLAPEDRGAVLGWLRAIQRLQRQAPGLFVVPGHDFEEISDPQRPSGMHIDLVALQPLPPPPGG